MIASQSSATMEPRLGGASRAGAVAFEDDRVDADRGVLGGIAKKAITASQQRIDTATSIDRARLPGTAESFGSRVG